MADEALLDTVHAARETVAAAGEGDSLTEARASLAEAVHALMMHVSVNEVPGDVRQKIDLSLVPHAAALKSALYTRQHSTQFYSQPRVSL